jgi:inner membrane protein
MTGFSHRKEINLLFFGHIGITIGIAEFLTVFGNRRRSALSHQIKVNTIGTGLSESFKHSTNKASTFTLTGNHIDIRVLILGSMLPDIIDKPVGKIFFPDTFSNGRIFSHSLLFMVVLAIAGLFLYRWRSWTWLLVLSFSTFIHLVLDEMWHDPETLFWPAYGLTFEKHELMNWGSDVLYALLHNPGVYVPEIIGIAILIWFLQSLVRRGRLLHLLKYGQS